MTLILNLIRYIIHFYSKTINTVPELLFVSNIDPKIMNHVWQNQSILLRLPHPRNVSLSRRYVYLPVSHNTWRLVYISQPVCSTRLWPEEPIPEKDFIIPWTHRFAICLVSLSCLHIYCCWVRIRIPGHSAPIHRYHWVVSVPHCPIITQQLLLLRDIHETISLSFPSTNPALTCAFKASSKYLTRASLIDDCGFIHSQVPDKCPGTWEQ